MHAFTKYGIGDQVGFRNGADRLIGTVTFIQIIIGPNPPNISVEYHIKVVGRAIAYIREEWAVYPK